MRRRVLFAWELGAGRGHLAALSGLCAAFEEQGFAAYAALAALRGAGAYFPNGHLLQAPRSLQTGAPIPARTWSDVLRPFGWAEERVLASLVQQWRLLADLVRPELIVVDAAPTALLALGDRHPMCRFSVPHFQPPPSRPLPAFDGGDHAAREEELLQIARSVSGRPLESFGALFSAPGWMTAPARLDPWERPDGRYVGPSIRTDIGASVEWPDASGPRVFAYVDPAELGSRSVLAHLQQRELRAVVSCPTTEAHAARWSRPHVRVHAGPVQLAALASQADVAITHSANGTASAFLAEGVPVLLLPRHHEQRGAADRVCTTGAAVQIGCSATPKEVGAALDGLLGTGARSAAARIAPDFVSTPRSEVARQMLEACGLGLRSTQATPPA